MEGLIVILNKKNYNVNPMNGKLDINNYAAIAAWHYDMDYSFNDVIDEYNACMETLYLHEKKLVTEELINCIIEYAKLFLDENFNPYKHEETLEDMFPGEYKLNEPI